MITFVHEAGKLIIIHIYKLLRTNIKSFKNEKNPDLMYQLLSVPDVCNVIELRDRSHTLVRGFKRGSLKIWEV